MTGERGDIDICSLPESSSNCHSAFSSSVFFWGAVRILSFVSSGQVFCVINPESLMMKLCFTASEQLEAVLKSLLMYRQYDVTVRVLYQFAKGKHTDRQNQFLKHRSNVFSSVLVEPLL